MASGRFRGGEVERRCGVTVKLMLILGLVYCTIGDGIVGEISYGWYSGKCKITG